VPAAEVLVVHPDHREVVERKELKSQLLEVDYNKVLLVQNHEYTKFIQKIQ